MATPHVVGLAAYYASKEGGSGQALCDKIVKTAQSGLIKNPGSGSPNLLAFNGVGN